MAKRSRGKGSNTLLTTQNVVIAGVVLVVAFLAYDISNTPSTRSTSSKTETDSENAPYRPPKSPAAKELTPEEEAKKQAKQINTWLNIGRKYFSGAGRSTKDIEKAVDYIEMAADAGNGDATYMIGQCYYYGYAVKQDVKKGKEFLTKALEGAGDDSDMIDHIKKLTEATDEPGTLSVDAIEALLEFDTGNGNLLQRTNRAEREEAAKEKAEKEEADDDDESAATSGGDKEEEEDDVEEV